MLSLPEPCASLSGGCWEIGMRYPAGIKVWKQRSMCHIHTSQGSMSYLKVFLEHV